MAEARVFGSEGWGQSHAQPWGLSLGFGELIVPLDLVDLHFFFCPMQAVLRWVQEAVRVVVVGGSSAAEGEEPFVAALRA